MAGKLVLLTDEKIKKAQMTDESLRPCFRVVNESLKSARFSDESLTIIQPKNDGNDSAPSA